MILPQNVGLASWAKLREEKEFKFIGCHLDKRKSFLREKKMILGRRKKKKKRKCKPNHPDPSFPEPYRINLFSLIFKSKDQKEKTALGKDVTQLISFKFSRFIIFSKIPAEV